MRNTLTFSVDRDKLAVTVSHPGYGSLRDYAFARASQLEALLFTLTGDGFESFDSHCPEIKQNVLWLAAQLAEEVSAVVEEIGCRKEEGPRK